MANLKCAKCGAEITEEQLTCSACGFVNDIDVCKKLAQQEEAVMQEKAEKEQAEKLAEQKKKLSSDKEIINSYTKKANLILNLITAIPAIVSIVILLITIINLKNTTSQFEGIELTPKYSQTAGILCAYCVWLSMIFNKLGELFILNSLSKKIVEINLEGKEWLKDFKQSKCANGITLEVALSKEKRSHWIAMAICHNTNSELKIMKKEKIFSLLSAIICGFFFASFFYFLVDTIIKAMSGLTVNQSVICFCVSFVLWIISAVVLAIVSLKVNKGLSEELKKFDVQPAQPEQNA